MSLLPFSLISFLGFFLSSLAFGANPELDKKIQKLVDQSLPRLACNMDVGTPGAIIASPENKAPDYYYHWIRDSALIMDSLNRLLPHVRGAPAEAKLHKQFADFSLYSEKLQNSSSKHGAGEVRFNVDGSVDESEWPRPQHDGPALRAITLMNYLRDHERKINPATAAQMRKVIRRDLQSVLEKYNEKGFDLWEYSNGFHFYTRMVQEAALRTAIKFFPSDPQKKWSKAANELHAQLQGHWNEKQGVILFNDGPATDDKGKTIGGTEKRFDTSVVLAVNHASLPGKDYTNADPKVWATLQKLEEYFRRGFPLNAGRARGPGIGRHEGDGYYGGNAFFFLTAGFAEHNLRLAKKAGQAKGEIVADAQRKLTLEWALQRKVAEGEKFSLPNKELAEGFAKNGDAFLETMLDQIPKDGAIAEQFSKKDGSLASAKDLSWSYTSILSAALQREELGRSSVNYKKMKFECPKELRLKGNGSGGSEDAESENMEIKDAK